MKKIFAIIMAVMLIVLAGCSGNKEIPIEDQAKRAVLGEWTADGLYLGDEAYNPEGTKCTVTEGIVFTVSVRDTVVDFDKFAYSEEATTNLREGFTEEDYPTLYAFNSREDSTTFFYYIDKDNREALVMFIPKTSNTETVMTHFVRA
ncbi:MAG: hypothetical protein IJG64_01325 [Oscillospiraceae bacterium]|nr:hypothetical protein [Oscillospiraceae bacterium]